MRLGQSTSITDEIISTAQEYGVDPNLALEVAQQESGLNQNAVSPTGAIGIFQLEPGTAAMLGVDPTDPTQNIQGGIAYLSQLLSRFNGDTTAALAAYNAGPTAVDNAQAANSGNWLENLPAETQNYVQRILTALGEWTSSATAPALAAAPGMPAPTVSDLWDSLGPTGQVAAYVGLGILGFALLSFLFL
jgi:soluble lytic murein transglycosylase-like protein